MDEHAQPCREQVFEIIWRQHDRNDWMAEVTDTGTDQRRLVHSWEELERFVQSQLRIAGLRVVEL